MRNETKKHCINVLQVFDWVSKPVNIKLGKSLRYKKYVTDEICGNIDISCGENALLWKVSGNLSVSGSVKVSLQTACEQIEVIVNGRTAFILTEEEQTMSFNDLRSVEVRCKGTGHGYCTGKYCITLHYHHVNSNCLSLTNSQLGCFLSDEHGNPTHSLMCEEIIQPFGRQNIEMTLPNGKTVVLQKIKVMKTGFLTVTTTDEGKACKLCTIPFQLVETFILCAPLGTFVACEMYDFESTVSFTNDCKKLDVEIVFCQEIQVIGDTTISVVAHHCHPRSVLG